MNKKSKDELSKDELSKDELSKDELSKDVSFIIIIPSSFTIPHQISSKIMSNDFFQSGFDIY
jgi:hypothetical protein